MAHECEFCGAKGVPLFADDGFTACESCKDESRPVAQSEATRGGWYYGKWLTAEEIAEAEKRWKDRSYKTLDEYGEYQCGGCKHFAAFGADFGVCCNSQSERDGMIVFEHGGCKVHSVKLMHEAGRGLS